MSLSNQLIANNMSRLVFSFLINKKNKKKTKLSTTLSVNHMLVIVFLVLCVSSTRSVKAECLFNKIQYEEYSTWTKDCMNCTCIQSVPYCEKIQCKYEPCEQGKKLILNNDQCCPVCQEPKRTCSYDGYLINHNTEFSPKICTVCKCKDGTLECMDTCSQDSSDLELDVDEKTTDKDLKGEIKSLNERKSRLGQHRRSHKIRNSDNDEKSLLTIESGDAIKAACYHNDELHQFNSTWSPVECTRCKCGFNSVVDCFVIDCPPLNNCSHGVEFEENECCPKCKEPNKSCLDPESKRTFKSGDFWTSENDPCVRFSCVGGKINSYRENCTKPSCKQDEILVTKSNQCCPKCESQMSDNCDYYGRLYYNGEMWYTKDCQHCACSYGRVVCMNVECESTFCLKDEIMVQKKENFCCLECRAQATCQINSTYSIKENQYWIDESQKQKNLANSACRVCQCKSDGQLECFSKSCQSAKFATYANLKLTFGEKKFINAKTIPFLSDFIKAFDNKLSQVYVIAGPKYSNIYLGGNNGEIGKPIQAFLLQDITASRIYYQIDEIHVENELDNSFDSIHDFAVLTLISSNNTSVQNILLQFEVSKIARAGENALKFNLDRNIRDHNDKSSGKEVLSYKASGQTPRKTIYIQPGEDIKLTSNELKPKNLPVGVKPEKLIYFLVSGNPKYGELKLKKLYLSDEVVPAGWNKVNDIYLEKEVKEFTQSDLDNGNVWYEPFNDFMSINEPSANLFNSQKCQTKEFRSGDAEMDDDYSPDDSANSKDCDNSFQSSSSNQARYDHCMFEVYDQDKLSELISKEIIHFSIQNEVINETVLGLEVIENQITPLAYSNFDIAGIDSNRDYLVYKVIKGLEKNQGQLEHSGKPGVPIDTFTQSDLNKGLILYYSPREIGTIAKDFMFTFVVTNDHRSDTFPETPFHIRVLPANDQPPVFKVAVTNIELQQGSSLVLPQDLFDIDDPDTSLEQIVFTIEKAPDNLVVELRSKGQRYVISKDDSFNVQEIRDGTFRLVHPNLVSNGSSSSTSFTHDSFKISASDNKHVSIKTVNVVVKINDQLAPQVSNRTNMLMQIDEGQIKSLSRENLAFQDDHSDAEQIVYKLVARSSNDSIIVGKLYKKNQLLVDSSTFTQADIDLQNIRYEAPSEIGANILTEIVWFDVSDKEGNVNKDQALTVKIEPVDNQAPIVDLLQAARIDEGGYLLLNESFIQIRDIDSAREQLNIIIDSQPSFGFLENIQKGNKLNSFSLVNLIEGQAIRYVQSDHKNKEPTTDSFIFHASDGINESPTFKFIIDIQPINDEEPVVVFESFDVELNKRTTLTNSSLLLVDFDTKPEDLTVTVEKLPRHGKLFNSDAHITQINNKFSYQDVLNKQITYLLDDANAFKDDLQLHVSDGAFEAGGKLSIKRVNADRPTPVLERNQGLQAIAGHLTPITKEILNAMISKKTTSEDEDESGEFLIDYENGVGGESEAGLNSNLTSAEYLERLNSQDENLVYHIVKEPEFGKLQYRFESFYEDLTGPKFYANKFSQSDIDQGRIFYNHDLNEPDGITSAVFNISDANEQSVLADQRFVITVRGDKLPPVVTLNKGVQVFQTQSTLLTRNELDVKDDDTVSKNLRFVVVTQPKLGRLERTDSPGKRVDSFSYDDLVANRIKYVHDEMEFSQSNSLFDEPFKSLAQKDDWCDLKVTDGKNDAMFTLQVFILRQDNQAPRVISTYSLRVRELTRKQLTSSELRVLDSDSSNDQLKIIVTHAPQFGTLEKRVPPATQSGNQDKVISINTNTNQKLNFILKFNHSETKPPASDQSSFVPVNEFTMADINNGLIYYNHRSPGVHQDRFGFVVFDGFNHIFLLENGAQVSEHQLFNIYIDLEKNSAPVIERNTGLDYLYLIDNTPGRLITKNDFYITDKDDLDRDIRVEITRQSQYGYVEHRDARGVPLSHFTQADINANTIFYILDEKKLAENYHVTDDSFEFDVRDSTSNVVRGNKFSIRWSIMSFDESEMSVLESESKVRVHIKKTGNLKRFSMITCKTESDTAKSNRDSKQFDFMHTNVKVEFNEDESLKACDVMLNRDQIVEGIESFWVVLEDPRYSVIGSRRRIKVNILDRVQETLVEFEKVTFETPESAKFISVPILRRGTDLSTDVYVDCITADGTAIADLDYVPRYSNSHTRSNNFHSSSGKTSRVRIPPGEKYGFCDVEIVDDDINEMNTESFKVLLVNPSHGARLGSRSEAVISIIGPNDALINNCKTEFYTVTKTRLDKIYVEISRDYMVNQTVDVLIKTIKTDQVYMKSYLSNYLKTGHPNASNISMAVPYEDYEPLSQVIKFLPGETNKKFYLNTSTQQAFNSNQMKIFTIQLKPLVNKTSVNLCNYVNPDFINVIIQNEKIAKNALVGFNQSSLVVNETARIASVPIVRIGDLSSSFSVICVTRPMTAIENKDYIGRGSFEQFRIYFEPGERVKYCDVELIDDSVFEADETFQLRLSDLRGPADVNFNQFNQIVITILNNEDASVLSLSDEVYFTEEPSTTDSSVYKQITVIRSGDLSRVSLVRVSTLDETAVAGLDYKPKTEILQFNQGISALKFEIEIFPDEERENTESFKVILGPQDPVSGMFGRIKQATVFIQDNTLATEYINRSQSSNSLSDIGTIISQKPANMPYINSLDDFIDNLEDFSGFAPNGKPLICLEPCDPANPNHQANQQFCENLFKSLSNSNGKEIKTTYSWEISTPNEFNEYSQFVKLSENTFFSVTNESILESVYFQPRFRVRCAVKYLSATTSASSQTTNHQEIFTLKSNHMQILDIEDDPDMVDYTSKCMQVWQEKSTSSNQIAQSSTTADNSISFYSSSGGTTQNSPNLLFNTLPLMTYLKFNRPFLAQADYVSADFITSHSNLVDSEHLNYIRISVQVPYIDGFVPLISTQPMQHNYAYLLGDELSYQDHICSNFVNVKKLNVPIKYGFVKSSSDDFDHTDDDVNRYRNTKTTKFYSNLDKSKCLWEFVAFYDISELTTHCQAQIMSSAASSDLTSNSYLTIRIPLYVSYLYAGAQASWSSIDYKTNVEASIIYKTMSFPLTESGSDLIDSSSQLNELNDEPVNQDESSTLRGDKELNENLISLTVTKIGLIENGRLSIEFVTVPAFHGQFIRQHPHLSHIKSTVIGPNHDDRVEFNLDLIWSQYTYDYPEQTWRATSSSILNNFSGNYTIILIPCYAKPDQAFKFPFECEPKSAINYTIPVVLEQSIVPVPIKHSLGTKFTVSTNLFQSISQSYENSNFDGYFRRGDNLYGTIIWDGYQDQKRSMYKLEIEKLYVCSTHNDMVPIYDPDGTIFNKGPQYGCTRPDKFIKNRILILDRASPSGGGEILQNPLTQAKKSKLDAKFFADMFTSSSSSSKSDFTKYMQQQNSIIDGFKFNVDYLFEIENMTRKPNEIKQSTTRKDSVWYLQAVYSIRPYLSIGNRPARDAASLLNQVYNNGTNIQIVKLSNQRRSSSVTLFNSKFKSKMIEEQQQQSGSNHKKSRVVMGNSTFTRLMPLILLIIILVIIITITFIYLYHNYYNKIPLSEKPIDCWYWKRHLGWKMSSVEKKRRQHQQYLVAAAAATKNQQSRLLPHSENRENSTTESEEKELMLPSHINQQNNQNKMLNEESNLTFQTLASTPINSHDEILKKPKRTPSSLSSIWKRFSTNRIVKSNRPTETVINRQAQQLSKQQQILNFTDNGDYDDLPNTPPTIVKSTVPVNFIDSSCQKHSYMASSLSRPGAGPVLPTSLSSSSSSSRPHHPTKNNYLYFNYNNNKMNNFFNSTSQQQPTTGPVVGLASPVLTNSNNTTTEIVVSELLLNEESCNKMAYNNLLNDALHVISSMASSTPTQITPVSSSTKSSTNQKRLSGTEV